MSTSGDIQYIGEYHDACGGYHEYMEDVQYIGGYHDACGDIMSEVYSLSSGKVAATPIL